MSCPLCNGTKIVVDGGTAFPCVCRAKTSAEFSPVDAVIYGTTYAVVLDRSLKVVWSDPRCCNNTSAMEEAELAAVKDAVVAAAHAVLRFHDVAKAIEAGWSGTEAARFYAAAVAQRR